MEVKQAAGAAKTRAAAREETRRPLPGHSWSSSSVGEKVAVHRIIITISGMAMTVESHEVTIIARRGRREMRLGPNGGDASPHRPRGEA